jgi:hypothetical protein
VGALRSIQEAMRFFGQTDVTPTAKADEWKTEIIAGINKTLKSVAEAPSFVDALYGGLLGDKSDGVYPGRAGKNSVITVPPTNGNLVLPRVAVRKKPVAPRKASSSRPIAARRCRA